MNIRKANVDDIELLVRLRIDYLLAEKGNLKLEDENAIRIQLPQYFSKHINNDFIAVLAEEDGKAVSAAFLVVVEKPANPMFITGRTGTVLNVLTYPEYRRQGIASMMLNMLIDEAIQMNVSSLDLSATSDGKPLYEKLGFTEINSKYTAMKLQLR